MLGYPVGTLGIALTVAWIWAMYYITLPGVWIQLKGTDDISGLKETGHAILFMIAILVLGPMVINMLGKFLPNNLIRPDVAMSAFGQMLFGRKR
jgi:hypothetical protein